VPFAGNSLALTALLGRQVEISFASLPSAIEFIRTGKVKGLGVTSTMRFGRNSERSEHRRVCPGLRGELVVRRGRAKGTPPEVIDKLNEEI
jgi:hypothetical protein